MPLPRPALLRRSRPPFLGWWVVTGGFSLFFLNALFMQSFGGFFVHLKDDFHWSRTVLAGAFSMGQVVMGLMGPFQGLLVDRLGSRVIGTLGVVVFATGITLLGFTNGIAFFYGAFFVISIGGQLMGWITLSVAVSKWFRRKRAMTAGIVNVGQSIGGIAVPLVALLLSALGWRATAFALGAFVLVVGLPMARLLYRRPEDYGLALDGDPSPPGRAPLGAAPLGGAPSPHPEDFTAREALRTPAFWLIGLGHASALLVVFAVNVHLIPHLVDRLHYSLGLAGSVLAMMTMFTITGQLLGGYLSDHFDKRTTAAIAMSGHVLGILALAFAANFAWVIAFAVLHGTAWGVRGPIMGTLRADYFGTSALGAILGLSAVVILLGTVGGPLLAGALADATGDYRLGFVVLAIVAGLGTLFFLALRKPVRTSSVGAGGALTPNP